MRSNKRTPSTTHISPWKQYGWLRVAGFVALCIPYVILSSVSSSNNVKTVRAVRTQLKTWPYSKESCLKEEKKEKINLQCEYMRGRLFINPQEFNKTDVHTTQAWTTDAGNNYYLLLEVKSDKDGNFLSYRSIYVDPAGNPLTMSPREYTGVAHETPPSADSVPAQYIPTEPSPESDSPASDDNEFLENLQVNPDFQLKVE